MLINLEVVVFKSSENIHKMYQKSNNNDFFCIWEMIYMISTHNLRNNNNNKTAL